MQVTTNECAKDLAVALGRHESEVEGELRLASALKLFETGRISSGLAARLSGMSRVEFLFTLGRYDISVFQQNQDELLADADRVMELSD
jgi:predicted HTH domain antitoxin